MIFDSIVDFIENELVIEHIFLGIGMYLLLLWLLVPIWVFLDSKKIYENTYLSIIFFITVLPLNIPGLIFYIIIRPDEHTRLLEAGFDHSDDHLINVPMVNFLSNKKDLVMSLELKINGDLLRNDVKKDLNLNVTLDAENDKMELVDSVEKKETSELAPRIKRVSSKIKGGFKRVVNRLGHTVNEVRGFFVVDSVDNGEGKETEKETKDTQDEPEKKNSDSVTTEEKVVKPAAVANQVGSQKAEVKADIKEKK